MSDRVSQKMPNVLAFAVASSCLVQGVYAATVSSWNVDALGSWSDSTKWNNGVPGNTATTANLDTATFNSNVITTGRTVTVDAGRNLQNINFTDNSATGASAYTLSSGSLKLSDGGSMLMSGGSSSAHTNLVSTSITVQGNYALTNNNTNNSSGLKLTGTITPASGLGAITLTLNGSNTSSSNLLDTTATIGTASNTTLAIVKDGAGLWQLNGTNTFTGGVTVKQGGLVVGGSTALGTGTANLGDSTAGQDATITVGSNLTVSNALSVASGAGNRTLIFNGGFGSSSYTGAISLSHDLTIGDRSATSSRAFTIGSASNGITGTGNLTISNQNTNAGLTLAGAVNNAGTVTNLSTSASTATVNGSIGSNVTSVTENSATSSLTLNASNSYGKTFVSAGTLATGAAGSLGTGDVTVADVTGATLTLGNASGLADSAVLSVGKSSIVNLSFAGVDSIGALLNSTTNTYIAAGTYSASQLNSLFASTTTFAGTGQLKVVPEPTCLASVALVLGGLLGRRRRSN